MSREHVFQARGPRIVILAGDPPPGASNARNGWPRGIRIYELPHRQPLAAVCAQELYEDRRKMKRGLVAAGIAAALTVALALLLLLPWAALLAPIAGFVAFRLARRTGLRHMELVSHAVEAHVAASFCRRPDGTRYSLGDYEAAEARAMNADATTGNGGYAWNRTLGVERTLELMRSEPIQREALAFIAANRALIARLVAFRMPA